jgi:hypothetical protein
LLLSAFLAARSAQVGYCLPDFLANYPSFSKQRSNWLIARLRQRHACGPNMDPMRPIVRIAHLIRKIDLCDREIAQLNATSALRHPIATRLFLVEPGIARRVFARIVGVEIDETTVDLPISDFEDVAPTTGCVLWNVRAPRPIAVLAVTRPFTNDEVLA